MTVEGVPDWGEPSAAWWHALAQQALDAAVADDIPQVQAMFDELSRGGGVAFFAACCAWAGEYGTIVRRALGDIDGAMVALHMCDDEPLPTSTRTAIQILAAVANDDLDTAAALWNAEISQAGHESGVWVIRNVLAITAQTVGLAREEKL